MVCGPSDRRGRANHRSCTNRAACGVRQRDLRSAHCHLVGLLGRRGMPASEVTEQMQTFETAIEASLEQKGVGVQAACLTGNGAREWRYYTYDTDEFMAKLNAGLAGHTVYPLRIQLFSDPEWTGLSFARGSAGALAGNHEKAAPRVTP
jgi:hypothetical protein